MSLERFLAACGWAGAAMAPLAGDASTRRYWRLRRRAERAVLMEDPPPDGTLAAFLRVVVLLRGLGLSAPAVYWVDLDAGLALVEDLGDDGFAALIDAGADPAPLLGQAVDLLIALHRRFRAPAGDDLPVFDAARFAAQAGLFAETFAPEHAAGFAAAWREVLPPALAVPASLLLRDYHVGNLVRVAGRTGAAACGLLDVQDAGLGPVTYDLASLIHDARHDIPAPAAAAAVDRYAAAFPALGRAALDRSLAVLTVQRDLRVMAIFRRLGGRGRTGYLVHLPRLAARVRRLIGEPALGPVAAWLGSDAGHQALQRAAAGDQPLRQA